MGDLWDDEPTKRISKKILRRTIWERDKGKCRLCGTKIRAGEDWDIARQRAGGSYTVGNTYVAHHTCNISQGRSTVGEVKRMLGILSPDSKKKERLLIMLCNWNINLIKFLDLGDQC
jgi:hypothetical protein